MFHMINLPLAHLQLIALCSWLHPKYTVAIKQLVFSRHFRRFLENVNERWSTVRLSDQPHAGGFGDKWSLLIIRDMMFGNRRHFRELLTRSEEGIASNILADRLKPLLEPGISRAR